MYVSNPGNATGDRSWTAPTLLNAWAQVAGWSTVGFRKDGQGFVHLRGRLTGGIAGTTIFTLPAGYRPGSGTMYFMCTATSSGDGIAANDYISVGTDGTVKDQADGGTNRIALDGITFLAEN